MPFYPRVPLGTSALTIRLPSDDTPESGCDSLSFIISEIHQFLTSVGRAHASEKSPTSLVIDLHSVSSLMLRWAQNFPNPGSSGLGRPKKLCPHRDVDLRCLSTGLALILLRHLDAWSDAIHV